MTSFLLATDDNGAIASNLQQYGCLQAHANAKDNLH